MENLRKHAQPIEDWEKMIPEPQTPEPKLRPATQRNLCEAEEHPAVRRINVMVQIDPNPELWTLEERDSGRQHWEALDKLLWGSREEEPPIWIEKQTRSASHGWYVIFNGRMSNGEDLIELGRYKVRFRIRGDPDVRPATPQTSMTTRSQAKAKAEAKAGTKDDAVPSFDVSGLLQQIQTASATSPPPSAILTVTTIIHAVQATSDAPAPATARESGS
jgi:hypothetical protein